MRKITTWDLWVVIVRVGEKIGTDRCNQAINEAVERIAHALPDYLLVCSEDPDKEWWDKTARVSLFKNVPRDKGDWVRIHDGKPRTLGGVARGLDSFWKSYLTTEQMSPDNFEIILGMVANRTQHILEFSVLWDASEARVMKN